MSRVVWSANRADTPFAVRQNCASKAKKVGCSEFTITAFFLSCAQAIGVSAPPMSSFLCEFAGLMEVTQKHFFTDAHETLENKEHGRRSIADTPFRKKDSILSETVLKLPVCSVIVQIILGTAFYPVLVAEPHYCGYIAFYRLYRHTHLRRQYELFSSRHFCFWHRTFVLCNHGHEYILFRVACIPVSRHKSACRMPLMPEGHNTPFFPRESI